MNKRTFGKGVKSSSKGNIDVHSTFGDSKRNCERNGTKSTLSLHYLFIVDDDGNYFIIMYAKVSVRLFIYFVSSVPRFHPKRKLIIFMLGVSCQFLILSNDRKNNWKPTDRRICLNIKNQNEIWKEKNKNNRNLQRHPQTKRAEHKTFCQVSFTLSK